MAEKSESNSPLERVDQEFATQRTFATSSQEDEAHPEVSPQSPGESAAKMRAEATEHGGPLQKAKAMLREFDRDASGEYEARDDPDAPDHLGPPTQSR